ncbi:hypothetical protein BH23BAC1_BH23BAC1_25600 [soil metagenome]
MNSDNENGVYTIRINGVDEREVQANGKVSLNLTAGSYEIELTDLEEGYAIIGENKQTIEVMASQKTVVTFEIQQNNIPPSDGELEVSVSSPNENGVYTVKVHGIEEKEIAANGSISFELEVGSYEVELIGIEEGNVVSGGSKITVEIFSNTVTTILFEIEQQQIAQQIVFSSNRTRFFEIYAMDRDGSNIRQLTNYKSSDNYPLDPEISPDGQHILFLRDGNIYIMDIDGGNTQQITFNSDPENTKDYNPSWSADGSQIVFVRKADNDILYVMNNDGTNLRELIEGKKIYSPHISPDGSKVLFVRDFGGSDEGKKIYLIDSNGSNEKLFIDHSFTNTYPRWSPDGSRILFTDRHNLFIANQMAVELNKLHLVELHLDLI